MRGVVELAGLAVTSFRSVEDCADYLLSRAAAGGTGILSVAVGAEKLARLVAEDTGRAIYSKADMVYPDGVGATCVMAAKGCRSARVPGVELFLEVLRSMDARGGARLVLIGGVREVSEVAAEVIAQRYPRVDVVLRADGFEGVQGRDELIQEVLRSEPDLVAAGLGSPRQESLLLELREAGVGGLLLGIGGTLDILAGKLPRAPRLMRNLGLEWFHRLMLEPSRIGRQVWHLRYVVQALLGRV